MQKKTARRARESQTAPRRSGFLNLPRPTRAPPAARATRPEGASECRARAFVLSIRCVGGGWRTKLVAEIPERSAAGWPVCWSRGNFHSTRPCHPKRLLRATWSGPPGTVRPLLAICPQSNGTVRTELPPFPERVRAAPLRSSGLLPRPCRAPLLWPDRYRCGARPGAKPTRGAVCAVSTQ